MTIDIDKLREALKQEGYGLFFGGGFGGALVETFEIDNVTPEELIAIALEKGIDITMFEV